MNIYDMHIHSYNMKPNPTALIAEMDAAGVRGGCVFSNWPKECDPQIGTTFEERLAEALAWVRGCEDRLFPVLWIHPYEDNIIEKVHVAAEAGIAAFKIICTDFYVYEEPCLRLLREIASLDLPVIFHTGILWDGKVSSNYNRPLNWEVLLEIEGLRFSMGHCSWPWVDECIALYGKFLHSLTTRNAAEMFFDITPGTPEIYRRELLTKLFRIGYDVGHNILFGTDASAEGYRREWVTNWLKIDGKIMDDLGVNGECRRLMYEENLMRFLGKTEKAHKPVSPDTDDAHMWSAVNPEVMETVNKWYLRLGFDPAYNQAFYRALDRIAIADCITAEDFGDGSNDGERNLLTYLWLCEGVKRRYAALGIPEEILDDTLYDIVRWTDSYTAIHGTLYLGELPWLRRHMALKLFKLGRLQFAMAGSEFDIPKYGVKKDDPVIEVHIPTGEKLSVEACKVSLARAKEFFATFFPDYEYKCFTCHSWLLDSTLTELLPSGSNILAFREMFDVVEEEESSAILRYVFKWNTCMANVKDAVTSSPFAEKVKARAMRGGAFHESLGVIEK